MTQPYPCPTSAFPTGAAASARPRAPYRSGTIDAAALARAEAALKSLASQFDGWLQAEIDRLDAARAAVGPALTDESARSLYGCAHDLKGLGGTYQYPIVSRIAGSLSRLLSRLAAAAPLALVDAHIQAIHRMVDEHLRTDEDEAACAVAKALEAQVG